MNTASPPLDESGIPASRHTWNSRNKRFQPLQPNEPGPLSWRFIPGPVALDRLEKAYRLGKRATLIFLLLHAATKLGAKYSRIWVTLPARELRRFGIDGAAKGRAIKALERAGLLAVKRGARRSLQLQLVAATSGRGATTGPHDYPPVSVNCSI